MGEHDIIVYEHLEHIVIDIVDKSHWVMLSTESAKRLGRHLVKWAEKKDVEYVRGIDAHYEKRESKKHHYHLVHSPGLKKCPVCREEGKRSTIESHGYTETMLGVAAYFDKEGKYHVHNPNRRTTKYLCSQGHHVYFEDEAPMCPAECGWPFIHDNVIT